MERLKQRISKDGVVLPGNILKVSSFLNHQIDVSLLDDMAQEFAQRFSGERITRILTVEASGIAIACSVARVFQVPVVFAKKHQSGNIPGDVFTTTVQSFTHGKTYDIVVSKQFIAPDDSVLIIDDFLANGCAVEGLAAIVRSAGASLTGAGIVIEKGFQNGGARLRQSGIRVESLAIIASMSPETGVIFSA
jgi:xanthine phosphoribosyltransferase